MMLIKTASLSKLSVAIRIARCRWMVFREAEAVISFGARRFRTLAPCLDLQRRNPLVDPITSGFFLAQAPRNPASGFASRSLLRFDGGMPEPTRQKKITFGEMRAAGVRGLLIYCSDYKCGHWTAISGERWPDDVRLSDLEPLFTCQVCGQKGADVRPNFSWEEEARRASEQL
jgi:hypothetical protein